jgi:hypothetical protein
VMNWPPQASLPCTVRDVYIASIGASPLGSSKAGTDGAGLWAGQTGLYERIDIRSAGWEGLWVGALCRHAIIRNVRIDNSAITDPLCPGIGIYVEHAAQDVEITRCSVKPKKGGTALNFEWRYKDTTYGPLDEIGDGRAGCCRINVHHCRLYGHVVVDAGSYEHTFDSITFVGGDGKTPAISLPHHLPPGRAQSIVSNCDFSRWNGVHVAYHDRGIG